MLKIDQTWSKSPEWFLWVKNAHWGLQNRKKTLMNFTTWLEPSIEDPGKKATFSWPNPRCGASSHRFAPHLWVSQWRRSSYEESIDVNHHKMDGRLGDPEHMATLIENMMIFTTIVWGSPIISRQCQMATVATVTSSIRHRSYKRS